jgi:hypothetical protein
MTLILSILFFFAIGYVLTAFYNKSFYYPVGVTVIVVSLVYGYLIYVESQVPNPARIHLVDIGVLNVGPWLVWVGFALLCCWLGIWVGKKKK